jgi:hypothetical protein
VDAEDIRRLLLSKLGLRIEPEMSRYLAARLENSGEAVAVMAGDARTGAPIRRLIAPVEILQASLHQGST